MGMRPRRFLLYVVMDMSESMSKYDEESGQAKILTAMNIVSNIIESTRRNATLASVLRISLIGFNQDVSDLYRYDKDNKTIEDRDWEALETWWKNNKDDLASKCGGQTYFTILFKGLKEIIERDQKLYDPKKFELYRPVVYFLTDGRPFGDSETEDAIKKCYDELVSDAGDNMKPPAILTVGIGDAEIKGVEKYAAGRTWTGSHYGEYRKANKDMAFVFKGKKAMDMLYRLNAAVLDCITNSMAIGRPTGKVIEPELPPRGPIIKTGGETIGENEDDEIVWNPF